MACAAPIDPADQARGEPIARASDKKQMILLVIDAASARVEEANAAGRLFLGMPPSNLLPIALDSAMPAIQKLRKIASLHKPLDRETLTFWSNGCLASLTCSIKPVNANGSKHLMQLTEVEQRGTDATDASRPQPVQHQGQAELPDETLPPIKPRDDAETLREIARRIREGQQANIQMPAGAASAPRVLPSKSEPQDVSVSNAAGAATPRFASDAAELARLAHELKTPLSAIVAASEIMRDQRLGPMGNGLYLGYAGDIHESALHSLAVITNMLDSAGSAASQKIQNFDLNALTAATVSAMQPLADARGLTLALESDEGRLEINGDPTAIRQILFNLLTNATKFTEPGGAVHAGTGYLPDGSIYLVVRDTGEGMNEEMLARAFYEDTEGNSRRPGGGFGLGLPMVRRLVEANRGVIEIDSAPGKGTVVLISFPTRR